MIVKWLRRTFGGAEPALNHAPSVDASRGYEITDREPPLTPEMKAVAEVAATLARAINASLRACADEPMLDAKRTHIESARNDLTEILALAREYPYIKISQLDSVQRDIARLAKECEPQDIPTGSPALDPILESLSSIFHVINESIDIATKTKNPDTFASRIEVAGAKLMMAERCGQEFHRDIQGLSDARAAIARLKDRGPPATEPKRATSRVKPATQPSGPMPENMRPPELNASPWITSTQRDAADRALSYWTNFRQDMQNGEFWADRARNAKDAPVERLRICIENLPLPGAFRESAIATRALVRLAKKKGDPIERPLSLLYWLAAINSFYVPYSARLGQPGTNVMEVTSGNDIASLPFTYKELGYERLNLLTVTDRRAIASIWGDPDHHSTLHEMHADYWHKCEDMTKQLQDQAQDQRFRDLMG